MIQQEPHVARESTIRLCWSISEAAQAIGLSESLLRLEISLGKLLATKIGKRLLIRDSDLRAYLDAHACLASVSRRATDD